MKMIFQIRPIRSDLFSNGSEKHVGKHAFTLAELLLVLVLMGILTSGAVVAFQGRQQSHALRMTARDLSVAFEAARIAAKRKRLTSHVRFYNEHRQYRVEIAVAEGIADYEPVVGRAGILNRLPDSITISTVLADGMPINPIPVAYEFSPDGNGFHGKVVLQNTNGEVASVEVERETGQINVIE